MKKNYPDMVSTTVRRAPSPITYRRVLQWSLLAAVVCAGGIKWASSQTTGPVLPDTVNLSATPSAKLDEPSNVALTLSVEFPTVGAAYRGAYYVHDPVNNPYLGYWDHKGCYTYKSDGTANLGGEYFNRIGSTDASGYCTNAYSGNLLNYVATSAIDVLRLALTGGNRVVDTASKTVLERAYLYNGWNVADGTYFPVSRIKKELLGKVMPSAPAGITPGNDVYAGSCQDKIWFGTENSAGADCNNPGGNKVNLNPFTGSGSKKTYQPVYARVKVCDGTEATSRDDLCLRYPSGSYKPIGQIQRKSDGTRLSAFGYLADDSDMRYGGVLRAPMGYVGPIMPNGTGDMVANPQTEWDQNTGVFNAKPKGGSFAYSGVINYLNKFGTTGTKGYYKGLDPVGELYYESLRYFMGKGPTAKAISNYEGKEDGFPVYTEWKDPIENSCQRKNYILTIGDVNTHWDKELPGHGGSGALSADAKDPARGAEPLEGGGSFNAAAWTKVIADFETNANSTYTNSFSKVVSTRGNPNPNSNNNNLNTKATGSGNRSAYYWAGAAYWAHTQPIRNDNDAQGKSKNQVRVNTFAIDVDEGGNGSIDDDNPRTIKPRQSSFYLAGKYGWFNNTDSTRVNRLPALPSGLDLDGHPFRNVLTGANDNSRWQYDGAPNTPDGYVIASQAKKLMEGVARFFNSLGGSATPSTVVGLSSLNFSTASPDGAMFVPQFDPKNGAGKLLKAKMKFTQATGDVAIDSTLWDAGKILTDASVATGMVSDPMVKPADRKLFTYTRDSAVNRGGQIFSVGEKSKLDAAVLTALGTKPGSAPTAYTTVQMQDAAINWLRGDRSLEAGATNGFLRARTSVLGGIVNSGPVYKQGASSDVTGDGFATFAAAQKSRTAAVYVGSDDGFLHAFKADNGKELFAYMPRAVAEKAHLLAVPGYVRRPYVDAVPMVGEAQMWNTGASKLEWKTLLVSGMGGGAQGIFALDVTDPDNFSKSNVLFEFTDQDDVDMGNVVSEPRLVRMMMPNGTATPEYRWFVAVSSGYNNYQADGRASSNGAQALFLLSLDKAAGDTWTENTNYFKMKLSAPATGMVAALANPGVAKDAQGNAIIFYAGDTQGNLWKFDLQSGLTTANAASAVKSVPLAQLRDKDGKRQPMTTVPQVVPGLSGGYMVIFGTGKYLESADNATTETNSVYGIWDNLGTNATDDYNVKRSQLYQRKFDTGTNLADGDEVFTFGNGTTSGTYRGWYLDLPAVGERVVVDADSRFGYTAINSFVPPGDCSANGSGAIMTFDNLYGTSRSARDYRLNPLSRPRIVAVDMSAENAYTYTERSATGRRDLVIRSRPVSGVGGVGNDPTLAQGATVSMKVPAGRVGWRELKNF